MSERADYPIGAPCWVDTLQPDLQAAARFYGRLLGWRFDEPRPMPQPLTGQYLAARIDGRLVSGIGQAPTLRRRPSGAPTSASTGSTTRSLE